MNRVGRPISAEPKRSPKGESGAKFDWAMEASKQLRLALKARGWGYQELAKALGDMGFRRTPMALNRRINRGNFTAGFFLACVTAMGYEFARKRKTKKALSTLRK